jgi:glycosyltransferase involved in cell wall biosynthesis
MRYQLVSSITPTLASGTGLRTYGVTAALARHHSVELAYVVFGADLPALEYARMPTVTTRPLRASRGPRRALAYARTRSGGIPVDLARGVSPALPSAVDGTPPDTRVIADGPVAAAALLPLARRRKLIYLAHNLESSGFRGDPTRSGLERFERVVLRTFAESWMATRADEEGARALAGEPIATRYVPNVVDTERIAPVAPSRAGRLLFVGDFAYAPNLEALRFLAKEVLPAVWEHHPEVRLKAVGGGLEPIGGGLPASDGGAGIGSDPRIETPGFVEDLAGAYGASDIVLVPLLRGGGSPLKFVEGLAYGLPVVATAHAARLLEDGVAGRDFLAAEGGPEFAASLAALLDDPVRAARLGVAGRALAVRSYSIDRLAALLGSSPPLADN